MQQTLVPRNPQVPLALPPYPEQILEGVQMPASAPLADRQEVPSRTVRAVAKDDILEADMMEKKGDDDADDELKYRLSTVSSIFMHN